MLVFPGDNLASLPSQDSQDDLTTLGYDGNYMLPACTHTHHIFALKTQPPDHPGYWDVSHPTLKCSENASILYFSGNLLFGKIICTENFLHNPESEILKSNPPPNAVLRKLCLSIFTSKHVQYIAFCNSSIH